MLAGRSYPLLPPSLSQMKEKEREREEKESKTLDFQLTNLNKGKGSQGLTALPGHVSSFKGFVLWPGLGSFFYTTF